MTKCCLFGFFLFPVHKYHFFGRIFAAFYLLFRYMKMIFAREIYRGGQIGFDFNSASLFDLVWGFADFVNRWSERLHFRRLRCGFFPGCFFFLLSFCQASNLFHFGLSRSVFGVKVNLYLLYLKSNAFYAAIVITPGFCGVPVQYLALVLLVF